MNKFKKIIVAVIAILVIGVSSLTLFACTKSTEPKLALITPFKTAYIVGSWRVEWGNKIYW